MDPPSLRSLALGIDSRNSLTANEYGVIGMDKHRTVVEREQRTQAMRVGCATVDITPPPGLPLMGNFRDDYAARAFMIR